MEIRTTPKLEHKHMPHGTFICSGTLRNVIRSGGSPVDMLKRASLLFESVVVELWDNSFYTDSITYEAKSERDAIKYLSLVASGAFEENRQPNEHISSDFSENSAFKDIFIDINNDPLFSEPSVQNHISTTASMGLLDHSVKIEDWVAQDWSKRVFGNPSGDEFLRPSGNLPDQLEEMAFLDILHDIGMNTAISDIAPNVRPLVSNRYRSAFQLIQDDIFLNSEAKNIASLKSLYLIDPANLGWEQILEARTDSRIRDFWNQMQTLADIEDIKTQQELIRLLERKTVKEMTDLVAAKKSDLRSTVIEGVLGLLPIPIINPFSLYIAGREIKDVMNMKKRYNSLYFIQDHIWKP